MDTARSPLRLNSFVWESQPGRYVLTVIAHGMVKLMPSQEAHWIQGEEYPLGYDEAQTLTARLNLLSPFKPRADLVVVGTAYAPPGGEAERLVARVRVGDFSKAITVTGDRLWLRDQGRWGSSPPRPFRQLLLVPERAIRSAENPVGLDPAAIPIEGRLSLPNFEPAAGSFSAVLGPVPATAPSRRGLLSPPGVAWVTTLEMGRAPGPLPPDMNFAFFNLAPLDQQVPELPAGAAIVLENLHPEHSIFTSRLPPTVPRVIGVDPGSGRPLEPALRCDTLWIDAERELAWVVYRGTADLVRPDLPVSLSCSLERPQRSADVSPMSTQTLLTTQSPSPQVAQGLPFPGAAVRAPSYGSYSAEPQGGYYGGAPTAPQPTHDGYPPADRGSYPPPPPAAQPAPAQPRRSITAEIVVDARPPGLPFGEHPTGEWETSDLEVTQGGERHGGRGFSDESTPTPAHSPTAPPPPPSAFAGLPFSQTAVGLPAVVDAEGDGPETAPRHARLVPTGSPGPIPELGPTLQPDLSGLVEPPSTTLAPPAPQGEPDRPPFVAAPTIVSPQLATGHADLLQPPPVAAHVALPYQPPKASGSYPPPPPPSAWGQAASAPPLAPQPAAPEPTPEAPPVERDTLTIEECADVRAALSVRGADKLEVLARYRVSEATWQRVEREILKQIDEAAQSGDSRPLERYDDAFVGAQDRLRGRPIDGPAYARIQVAKELKQLAEVLEELQVGRNDLLRLDRVWRRRLAANRELAERIEDEMERLRHGAA